VSFAGDTHTLFYKKTVDAREDAHRQGAREGGVKLKKQKDVLLYDYHLYKHTNTFCYFLVIIMEKLVSNEWHLIETDEEYAMVNGKRVLSVHLLFEHIDTGIQFTYTADKKELFELWLENKENDIVNQLERMPNGTW
jgi:hypothetical protein